MEDGGESSEIFDYSTATDIVTFCRDPLRLQNVTTLRHGPGTNYLSRVSKLPSR